LSQAQRPPPPGSMVLKSNPSIILLCSFLPSDYIIEEKTAVLQKREHEGFGFVLRGAKGKGCFFRSVLGLGGKSPSPRSAWRSGSRLPAAPSSPRAPVLRGLLGDAAPSLAGGRASTASQNHRIVGVGRDLCGSPSPTLLPKLRAGCGRGAETAMRGQRASVARARVLLRCGCWYS